MAQYQSFPDAEGDSASEEKLAALRLPNLEGRSFMDVGCNEGFFCGYARFAGASRIVGIDKNATFINRAVQRFPGCEFLCRSWEELPNECFDVILLASSLHYAFDQEALLHRLLAHLDDGGTLVVELGIVRKASPDWVEVRRSIDTRRYPTMQVLGRILEPYVWKHIGPSVEQAGDPVPRHVLHIRNRMPYAILLLDPPASGKSSFSRFIFGKSGPKVISGDHVLAQVAAGNFLAPPRLRTFVQEDFSILTLGDKIRAIFERDLGAEFLGVIGTIAAGQDFALDCYVPPRFHSFVQEHLQKEGYYSVSLEMGNDPGRLPPSPESRRKARDYVSFLKSHGSNPVPASLRPQKGDRLPVAGSVGFAERVGRGNGRIVVEGWAVDSTGGLPEIIAVQIGTHQDLVRQFKRIRRVDVQRHFGLETSSVGFHLEIADPSANCTSAEQPVEIFAGNNPNELSGPFRIVTTFRLDAANPDQGRR